MVVDPKWLAEKTAGGKVQQDRHCTCGYNLRGLRIGAPCPECGRAIQLASGTPRHVAKLTEYPLRLLGRLSLGATLLAFGMWGIAVGYLMLWFARGGRLLFLAIPTEFTLLMMILFVLPGTAMWWLGVVLLSRRGDGSGESTVPMATPGDLLAGRPAWFRPLMILSQALWPLGAAAAFVGVFVEGAKPVAGDVLLLSAVGAAFLAGLSLTPVCLMLKDLAHHAYDDYAFNRFHGLAFGIPIVAAIFALFPAMHLVIGFSRMINFIGLLTLSLLLTPPAYLMLMALWSLGTTCRWGRANAITAEEVEARFRERSHSHAGK